MESGELRGFRIGLWAKPTLVVISANTCCYDGTILEVMALNDSSKKQIPLRLSVPLWKELNAWAQDDFRSLNGQIEFLLNECVKRRKKQASQDAT